MKKLSLIIALLIVTASCKGNESKSADNLALKTEQQEPKLKRYDVKSGIVKYKTTISGKVMGSKIAGSGTEDLYFKNWGALELKEEQSSQTSTIKFFGKEKVEKTSTHTINKLDNGESFLADFETKIITAGRDPMMDLMKQNNTNASDVGKNMLESMGGEQIGTESVLGHTCEVWNIMGAKQWIYKGVLLKVEVTVLGIKTVTEATSAKFNVSVDDSNFNLPAFPIQQQEGFMNNDEYDVDMDEMNDSMDKISKLSFKEWKKMATKNDPEMKEMSDEELRQTYDMIQKMIKMKRGN